MFLFIVLILLKGTPCNFWPFSQKTAGVLWKNIVLVVLRLCVTADEYVYSTAHKTFTSLLGLRDLSSLDGKDLKLSS